MQTMTAINRINQALNELAVKASNEDALDAIEKMHGLLSVVYEHMAKGE